MNISYGKTLFVYSLISLLSTVYIINYEFSLHKKFYPSVLALISSPLNILIMSNFGIVALNLVGIMFVKFFFGTLRNLEGYVHEQLTKKLFYIIIFIYFTGIEMTDFLSIFYLFVLMIMYAIHKLLFKRAD